MRNKNIESPDLAYCQRVLKSIAQKKEELKQLKESNAEYQRLKAMTAEEKARNAINRVAHNRKIFNDFMTQKDTSFEQAKEYVVKMLRDRGKI